MGMQVMATTKGRPGSGVVVLAMLIASVKTQWISALPVACPTEGYPPCRSQYVELLVLRMNFKDVHNSMVKHGKHTFSSVESSDGQALDQGWHDFIHCDEQTPWGNGFADPKDNALCIKATVHVAGGAMKATLKSKYKYMGRRKVETSQNGPFEKVPSFPSSLVQSWYHLGHLCGSTLFGPGPGTDRSSMCTTESDSAVGGGESSRSMSGANKKMEAGAHGACFSSLVTLSGNDRAMQWADTQFRDRVSMCLFQSDGVPCIQNYSSSNFEDLGRYRTFFSRVRTLLQVRRSCGACSSGASGSCPCAFCFDAGAHKEHDLCISRSDNCRYDGGDAYLPRGCYRRSCLDYRALPPTGSPYSRREMAEGLQPAQTNRPVRLRATCCHQDRAGGSYLINQHRTGSGWMHPFAQSLGTSDVADQNGSCVSLEFQKLDLFFGVPPATASVKSGDSGRLNDFLSKNPRSTVGGASWTSCEVVGHPKNALGFWKNFLGQMYAKAGCGILMAYGLRGMLLCGGLLQASAMEPYMYNPHQLLWDPSMFNTQGLPAVAEAPAAPPPTTPGATAPAAPPPTTPGATAPAAPPPTTPGATAPAAPPTAGGAQNSSGGHWRPVGRVDQQRASSSGGGGCSGAGRSCATNAGTCRATGSRGGNVAAYGATAVPSITLALDLEAQQPAGAGLSWPLLCVLLILGGCLILRCLGFR